MLRFVYVLILLTSINLSNAQVNDHVYELNSIDNLITEDVKKLIDENLESKRVVFLGEAEHHIGSDFLAKSQFVRYLVLEKGYTEIAFESDFFGLYFDHNKRNLFPFWSRSVQCQALFEFLDEHNVTIWGFDNQLYSIFSQQNFVNKLRIYLDQNNIDYAHDFMSLAKRALGNGSSLNKGRANNEIESLIASVDNLLENVTIRNDKTWYQILESFKSHILQNNSKKNTGIAIRDTQMAKNLNFLVRDLDEKKIIVWLANAHMAKTENDFMKGQTMGSQFIKQNPGISYHIAFSSIQMPYRKERWLEKCHNDDENLLHFLPTLEKNFFLDSKNIINTNPEYSAKEYEGMFGLNRAKTNWFKHFDALVFISKGEKVKYLN
ncbi:erythromycin esterase family protein [Robertkochia sediminum]|uniref:erythromycin esterase family protein n=1 Tax=Robertkochia sediminum TaxID=2785326 RepID=UPI001934272C|nr:erythromycin esterase family protein [Robertkochia sediminum]MBL7473320.1 erythromycin esterase family protein [Robertkochia sediminum]